MQDKDNFPPNGSQDPGKVAQQATSLLYAGEHFDTDSQNYYLRARWYDSLSGRFNRMDPYAGSPQDPQSLHKYLYAHCNPLMGIDPSGEMNVVELSVTITAVLFLASALHFAAHTGWRRMKEDIRRIEGAEAITIMSTGLQEQMNWEYLATRDPEVLRFNLEFWHEKAELNKAVTLYNAKTEKNLLQTIDTAYHGLEIAGIGLGFAGGIARTPIFWSKPHPPTNPAHWQTIVNNATRSAAKGEAKAIYTHRYLSTITNGRYTARMAPDWAEVMPNGKLRLFEVVSPTQSYNKLLEKGWRYKQALGDTLEYYEILNIGSVAP